MSATIKYADVTTGDELAPASYPVTRLDLVRYCGASGDFNVIHWNERIARSVGLPNVIAHGMFTMASADRAVSASTTRLPSSFSSTGPLTSMVAPASSSGTTTIEDIRTPNSSVRRGHRSSRLRTGPPRPW